MVTAQFYIKSAVRLQDKLQSDSPLLNSPGAIHKEQPSMIQAPQEHSCICKGRVRKDILQELK